METYVTVANYTRQGMVNIKDAPAHFDDELQSDLPGLNKSSRHGRVPGNFKREAYSMSTEQNKNLIRRGFEEGINQHNLNIFDELLAPNYVNHNMPMPVPGPAGFKQVISMFLTAFPDFQITVDDVIAEGDKVATRGTWRGTHQGDFMGIPATGKAVTIPYIDAWRMENGRAVENWVQMDMLGLMQQLGVAPAPGQ